MQTEETAAARKRVEEHMEMLRTWRAPSPELYQEATWAINRAGVFYLRAELARTAGRRTEHVAQIEGLLKRFRFSLSGESYLVPTGASNGAAIVNPMWAHFEAPAGAPATKPAPCWVCSGEGDHSGDCDSRFYQ